MINSLKLLDVDTKHFSEIFMQRGTGSLSARAPSLPPERTRLQLRGQELHGAVRPRGLFRNI